MVEVYCGLNSIDIGRGSPAVDRRIQRVFYKTLFGAAACFSSEYVLSWNALCFVLNVEKLTMLGILLGLAPPNGLAVLEVVIARLFEYPWRDLRTGVCAAQRWLVRVAMGILLVTLAASDCITIWHLAKAREVAAQREAALNQPEAGEKELPSLDRAAIDQAVVWVSLLVSMDGAILLLLSGSAGRNLHCRRRADRPLAQAQSEYASLEAYAAAATSVLDPARENWNAAGARAEEEAERYREYYTHLLARRGAESLRNMLLDQRVSYALQLA